MALLSGFDQLNPASDTFADWLNKTNEIVLMVRGDDVTAAQTSIMTANSLPGGSLTYGNATIFGQFTANAMVVLNDGGASANTLDGNTYGGLRGGTWDGTSNVIINDTLYVVTNTNFTDETGQVNIHSTYGLYVENNIDVDGDVFFVGNSGSNTDPKMHWESDNNVLNFNDNVKGTWGTGDDLEVYYTGTRGNVNTDILDVRGSTNTNIFTDDFEMRSQANNELMLTANVANGVELYWDGTKKVSSNTYGVEVYGQVLADNGFVTYNNQKLEMGGANYAATHNLELWTDGTDSWLTETGGGDLYIQANNLILEATDGTNYFVGTAAANTTIHYGDGTKIVEVTAAGIDVIGEANTTTLRVRSDAQFEDGSGNDKINWEATNGILNFEDDIEATFGTDDDFRIYHDSANNVSYIKESGTGDFVLQANNMQLEDTSGQAYFCGTAGLGASVHYNGDQKLITTNIGIDVTGEANTDTLRVQSTSDLEDDIRIQGSNNTDTLTWDKSANTLNFDDINYITLGTNADFTLHHDGSNTYLTEVGSGELHIQANNIHIENTDGDEYFLGIAGAGAALHFAGIQKLITTNIGVDIEGEANTDTLRVQSTTLLEDDVYFDGTVADQLHWDSSANELHFKDSVKAIFGDSDDLQLYHNGTDSHIENSTGNFYIRGDNLQLTSTTGNEEYLTAVVNGGVSLYYDDAKKFETINTGVNVTGIIIGDSLDIDGDVDLGAATSDTITMTGRVDTAIVPSANVTHDLGTAALSWNNLYVSAIDVQSLQVDLNATVTGEVTANNFVGDGAQLTDLNGSEVTTGTVDAARIDPELTSNTSGTSAQSNTIQMHSSTTNSSFPVVFAAATNGYRDATDDATFTFNPSSDTLTVDNIVINTVATLPGNTTFVGTTYFEDIEVSGEIVANNFVGTSLEANNVAFSGTGGDVTTTSATIIDSFPIGQTQGFKYFVHGEVSNDADSGYVVEVNCMVTDNGDVYYTRYGEIENNMSDVTIVPTANSTFVNLEATCLSASVAATHTFKIMKIETRN